MLSAADVNPQLASRNPISAENSVRAAARVDLTSASNVLPMIAWATMLLGGGLIGVIIAYIDHSHTIEKYATHYQYLIRTFWIGLLFLLVSVLLSFLIVGLPYCWRQCFGT